MDTFALTPFSLPFRIFLKLLTAAKSRRTTTSSECRSDSILTWLKTSPFRGSFPSSCGLLGWNDVDSAMFVLGIGFAPVPLMHVAIERLRSEERRVGKGRRA